MSEQLGAVLIVEIGSIITRVTLVDAVDGETRVVGRAETMSSLEPPIRDAAYGLLMAAAQISETTGRQILREGQLLMPQSNERDGVNHVLVLSSAAGELSLVITAIARDISARSALQASRSTYTTVLQVITLDDSTEQSASIDDLSWIERQVQALLGLQPDAMIIAGGLEGGAIDAVNRLAHIVGLTAQRVAIDTSGQQSQNVLARPVIYAGNSGARERVIEALSDKAEIFVVDNVRPALDQSQLDGARHEIGRLYERLILPSLPGMSGLRRLSRTQVGTVCSAEGLMTRFLAERAERAVLSLDIGSASSSVFFAAPGQYHPVVLGATGTGYGISSLLARCGLARIARWLPFPIGEAELTHRLLNRMLRPQIFAASREDLYIDHALAREALSLALEALYDMCPTPQYSWVVAGGGVLAHAPSAGLALLSLLDVLQPVGQAGALLDVSLDTLGMLAACGALASLSVDGAVMLFDRDLLRNVPLATVVVPLGARPGEMAVEAELKVVGGKTTTHTVRGGEIACLPLPQGKRGQLVLRPASGVRVGQSASGVELRTELAELRGSALGVVIDARGRPLALPESIAERSAKIWEWLVALGVERGPSPYRASSLPLDVLPAAVADLVPASTAAVMPEPSKRVAQPEVAAKQPTSPSVSAGKRISLADLAAEEARIQPPEPPTSSPANDMDKLRQTVEAPKKQGLFGRKK